MTPQTRKRVLLVGLMWVAALGSIAFLWMGPLSPDSDGEERPNDGLTTTPDDRAPAEARSALPIAPIEADAPRMFRGDRRHTNATKVVGPNAGEAAWSYSTGGRIMSQAVVAPDGNVYVGSFDGFLYSIGPNGILRWKKPLEGHVFSTPAIDARGNVYVGSDGDSFFSFSSSGELRWRLPTEGDADTGVVIAEDGTIHFGAGRDLYAVSSDGDVRWRFRALGKIYSTPAVDDDGTVYVGSQDDRFYAIGPDGRLRWEFRTRDDNDASPVLADDGTIYFGSDDRHVYALDRDGQLKWAADLDGYVRAPIGIGPDGSILAATFGPRPRIACLETRDGSVRWSFSVRHSDSAEVGISSGPITDAEGNIYVGAHDDYVYSLTSRGTLRWIFATRGDVDSSPVIAPDGTLYVGSDDNELYAIRGGP
jgi:outer membrane protein assembly factor BamB